ncbi:MAG: DKNYY domain-containing protein [Candidatus Paceibacterota bacterium]|jgi:hypothetical protein
MKNISIIFAIIIALTATIGYWKIAHSPALDESGGYVVKNGKVFYEEVMQVQWDDHSLHTRINDIEVIGADAKTFMPVAFGKGSVPEIDADPQILANFSKLWGKDKNNIFFMGGKMMPSASTTPAIDTTTFKPLSNFFARDRNRLYLIIDNLSYKELPDLDPNSFQIVGGSYVKDANAVYYFTMNDPAYGLEKLKGVDPRTFHIVGECSSAEVWHWNYVADAKTVLAVNKIVSGADASTFHLVGITDKNPDGIGSTGSYYVDKNRVYRDCGESIPDVSPEQCKSTNLKACEGTKNISVLQSGKVDEHLTIDNNLRNVNFCGKDYQVQTVLIDGVDIIQRIAELSQQTNITSASSTDAIKTFSKNICGTVALNPQKNISLGEISIYAPNLTYEMMNDYNKTYGLYSSIFEISVTPFTNTIDTVSAFDGARTYLTSLK